MHSKFIVLTSAYSYDSVPLLNVDKLPLIVRDKIKPLSYK